MKTSALASGSSGNCFYIENDKKEGLIVDCGLSAKRICNELDLINRSPVNVKAILLTHEHTDHIKGADVLARKFGIPIYGTKGTLMSGFVCSEESLLNEIKNDETFRIAGLDIETFGKSHRAADPVFFSLSNGKRISVITDLGCVNKSVNEMITESNVLYLESNHDVKMLQDGPYPVFLKKWVLGNDGHLSNNQASLAVLEHSSKNLKRVFLSHLSQTNNIPELAIKTFNNMIKERLDVKIPAEVSHRDKATELMRL